MSVGHLQRAVSGYVTIELQFSAYLFPIEIAGIFPQARTQAGTTQWARQAGLQPTELGSFLQLPQAHGHIPHAANTCARMLQIPRVQSKHALNGAACIVLSVSDLHFQLKLEAQGEILRESLSSA